MNEIELNLITEKIIGSAYKVANELGTGFLEKVYENSMVIEMTSLNLKVEQQKNLQVFYNECIVGDYFCDLYVENEVIVELKVAKCITEVHMAQIMNYLKA